jgi:hypothetical protein
MPMHERSWPFVAVVLMAALPGMSRAAAAQHSQAAERHLEKDEGAGVVSLDVWASGPVVDLLLGLQRKGVVLVHRRSTDGGATWSADHPVPMASRAHSPHRGNDPQVAATGAHVVVTWVTPGTSKWGSGPLATAISDDGGLTWRAGPNPADDGSTDGHGYADLATDAAGTFLLAWLDSRDGAPGLRAATSADFGHTWSANRTVASATCECCPNRVASPRAGTFLVLFRDGTPRDTSLAVTDDGGATWSRRGPTGAFGWKFEGCPHVGGGIAVATGETHVLTWTGAEGRAGLYAVHSPDGGRTWSAPRPLGGPRAHHADLANSRDVLAGVWDEATEGGTVVMSAVSKDGGRTWAAPVRLSEAGGEATHPLVVATGGGSFLAAWTERGAGGPWLVRTKAIGITRTSASR